MIEKSLLTSINKPSEQLPEYLTKPNGLKNFFCIFFFSIWVFFYKQSQITGL